jgi:hypothetical protein
MDPIQIQKGQNNTDLTDPDSDPDPQHWFLRYHTVRIYPSWLLGKNLQDYRH